MLSKIITKKNSCWFFVFVGIFLLSVLVRLPFINRPLSHHHEWLTSTVLRHLDIWSMDGLVADHFSPPTTYPGGANYFINNQGNDLCTASGQYYYISYPPFAFLLPYAVMRVLHLSASVLFLQVFNLGLHLVNLGLIFLLIRRLISGSQRSVLALVGVAVYAFSPATLWFHSNVYMADMLVQTFFISTLLAVTRVWYSMRWGEYVFLGVSVFLMCYTEWLGVLLAGSIGLALFIFKPVRPKTLFFVLLMSSSLALGLMVWQYSQIAGLGPYLSALAHKFLYRSGVSNSYGDLKAWVHLSGFYMASYFPYLVFWGWEWRAWRRLGGGFAPEVRLVLFLAILPVVMHHFLLFNFTTVHDFSTLKFSVFLSLSIALMGMAWARLPRRFWVGFGLATVVALLQFWVINHDCRNPYQAFAALIREQPKTVLIVVRGPYLIDPQLIYYAKRNVVSWVSEAQIRELVRLNHATGVVVFKKE